MPEIIIRPEKDIVELDAWNRFAEELIAALASAPERIVIDMHQVHRMISVSIGSLISGMRKAHAQGVGFELINVQPGLFDVLNKIKLTDLMPVSRA